jgi:hypothetical protein
MEKILHAGYFEDIIKAFLSMEGEKLPQRWLSPAKREVDVAGPAVRTMGPEGKAGRLIQRQMNYKWLLKPHPDASVLSCLRT